MKAVTSQQVTLLLEPPDCTLRDVENIFNAGLSSTDAFAGYDNQVTQLVYNSANDTLTADYYAHVDGVISSSQTATELTLSLAALESFLALTTNPNSLYNNHKIYIIHTLGTSEMAITGTDNTIPVNVMSHLLTGHECTPVYQDNTSLHSSYSQHVSDIITPNDITVVVASCTQIDIHVYTCPEPEPDPPIQSIISTFDSSNQEFKLTTDPATNVTNEDVSYQIIGSASNSLDISSVLTNASLTNCRFIKRWFYR